MDYKNGKPDMTPVMLSDDIAFVGGDSVSVHCFIGKGGLILLDTGYPGMLGGIQKNMAALGLDIGDVKYIIHSHGHIDHYGSTAEIVRLTGAKTLLGREDEAIVTDRADLYWAKELGLEKAEAFLPDILFEDGTTLTLLGRRFRFVHAPGHTEGTYAIFADTTVNQNPMVAAMHGGVGINSMAKEFLESYGLPLTCREKFREGLCHLAGEKVDIVLGNHPQQNHTAEKTAARTADNHPFVDPSEWQSFLKENERNLDQMLQKEE